MGKAPTGRAAAVDLSRSAVSRYLQLAIHFRRRIETGYWHVGHQIPTVDTLAAEYGVARATIRQALAILEEEKLIERHRAKGTFVVYRPQERLWCEVETDWNGLLAATGADIEVLSQDHDVHPVGLMHDIGEPGPGYWHLRRRHSRHGAPYLLADIYIDEALRPLISDEALNTKSALRLLAETAHVDVADARQTLTLGAADGEAAEYLSIPLNAPVALVYRSAVDRAGRLVFYGIGVYRGDVVRLDLKLK